MLYLAIDTCLGSCSAAVFDASRKLVIGAERELMERGHAEALPPMVERVMHDANASFDQLSAIVVTIGPGTFTGIRIGLSFAQGLAMPWNIPLIGVTSMLATAAALLDRGVPIVVTHAAGASGYFYVQSFASNGAELSDIQLLRAQQIKVPAGAFIVGTAADQVTNVRRDTEHDLPDAKGFVAMAHKFETQSAEDVLPVYIREADAKPSVLQKTALVQFAVSRVGVEHAEVLHKIHSGNFAEGWSTQSIVEMLEIPGTLALLAQFDDTPVGFLIARAIAGEAEILTLATSSAFRRRGIANHLLDSSVRYLNAMQVSVLHLEVAADNTPAFGLYGKKGFVIGGRRNAYYRRPNGMTSDAILMRKSLR